jgi:tRNA pseudouridine55 synthase
MATGLLVLAIGSYTKKVPELTKQDKVYEATVTLGLTSNTDDAEGSLTWVADRKPGLEEISAALHDFVGTLQQVPPQFSAIKVGGVRSYDDARKGKKVKLEPRTITIYSISDISYTYPTVSFVVHVGSGTYIRSLARDLGEKLGVGAYLSALRRTSVGAYTISDAISPDNLSSDEIARKLLA